MYHPTLLSHWTIFSHFPFCKSLVSTLCTAGAAPFFMSERAMKKLKGRKTKVATYMLDMNLVGDYWGWYGKRWYHHTAPISMW